MHFQVVHWARGEDQQHDNRRKDQDVRRWPVWLEQTQGVREHHQGIVQQVDREGSVGQMTKAPDHRGIC